MNTGAIIFARTDSRRFPAKCFHYVSNYALLELVIKRAQNAGIGKVIVATTIRSIDDELAELAVRFGAHLFRGDPDNLVQRACETIDFYKLTSFCRVNGDSPFVDAALLRTGKSILSENINFVTNLIDRTFPYGVALEWIDSSRYKELAHYAERDELEHVTKHLYRLKSSLKFKSVLCELGNFSANNLTIDCQEDLLNINLMLEKIPKDALEVTYLDFIEKFYIENSKNDNNI